MILSPTHPQQTPVDGKSLKGQRNLDAVAGKVVADLLALLHRQGLLAG